MSCTTFGCERSFMMLSSWCTQICDTWVSESKYSTNDEFELGFPDKQPHNRISASIPRHWGENKQISWVAYSCVNAKNGARGGQALQRDVATRQLDRTVDLRPPREIRDDLGWLRAQHSASFPATCTCRYWTNVHLRTHQIGLPHLNSQRFWTVLWRQVV